MEIALSGAYRLFFEVFFLIVYIVSQFDKKGMAIFKIPH
jgi:hypothetical protein